ncbi:MAG: hypothetical protein IPF76_00010 [Sphingopyxis sp.]|nr:hypothetical protein [Sphingopyxis sp.]MBK6411481.1 hypothetical protein [Sphingopyxis sp.]
MSGISGQPAIQYRTCLWPDACASRALAGWRGGTPLLFLNGIGADLAAAAPLLAQIHGREVWTLDVPGSAGSPRRPAAL